MLKVSIKSWFIEKFLRVYDGTRYLVLFRPEKRDVVYNRIWYIVSQKSVITYVFFHNYARIKTDLHDLKEKFYGAKELIRILGVDVNNLAMSKLVENKSHSKYLIGYLANYKTISLDFY